MIGTDEFQGRRVAFVSTRIAGTDGVSLEIEKWAAVLERAGVECVYIAGESDRTADRTRLIGEAHFKHPAIFDSTRRAFASGVRSPQLTDDILHLAQTIRAPLRQALDDFRVDAVIAQNALTIPMNIPLGIALVQVLQETGLGCVAHHHDFYWERERFLTSGVDDFLHYAFPPPLSHIQHVAINSLAGDEFTRRTGLSCRVIPNVMDFANPPEPPDDYARSFRSEIGLADDELLILQPTRVVERKGIEHSVELVRRLPGRRARLVITHASGDEGEGYANFLRLFSDLISVDVLFASDSIAEHRGASNTGKRLFTLHDAYQAADLVAYPSEYEGFGNAFLEAVYYRKPIFCQRYPIYRSDIEPCGFQTVAFDEFVTRDTVDQVARLLDDESAFNAIVNHNYEVARRHFSYEVLASELYPLLRRAFVPCSE